MNETGLCGGRAPYLDTPLWDSRLSAAERIRWLLGEMTLDEKLAFLSTSTPAIERLGIGVNYVGGEAAHGVEARHDQDGRGLPETTTSFPQPIGMSASWDEELLEEAGQVVGKEARILYNRCREGGLFRWAPTVDMERDPRWGRTEEGYGEEPFLTGKMAAAYVRGMQGRDPEHLLISCALKHFFANNVENRRGVKSSSVGARLCREYYYEPFRRVIEESGATSLMTAYNKVNGVVQMLDHRVDELVRREWGLRGHVVCDGGAMSMACDMHHATNSHAETAARSLKAGVDCMTDNAETVCAAAREAYERGWIAEEDIDRALAHCFGTKLRLGLYDAFDANPWSRIPDSDLNSEAHRAVSRRLARESVVLLKNDGLLPLAADQKVSVIGPLADIWYQDWYGGEPFSRTTVLEGLRKVLKEMRSIPGEVGEAAFSGTQSVESARCSGLAPEKRKAGEAAFSGRQSAESAQCSDLAPERRKTREAASAMTNGPDALLPYADLTPEMPDTASEEWAKNVRTHRPDSAACLYPADTMRVPLADGLDRVYLKCGDRYAAVDEDRRLFLTKDRARAEKMVVQDWDNGRFTFYVPALGCYLEAEDDGRIKADKKDIFSWFVKECFLWTEEGLQTWYHSSLCAGADGYVTAERTVSAAPVGVPQGDRLQPGGECASIRADFELEVLESGTERAAKLAAESDAVILVLGCCPMINGKEDADRPSIAFPAPQRALAQAVLAVNPNTVMVLISNYPYAIDWEQEHMPAILWSASGSQDLGTAVAETIFGLSAPAGCLNMTWYPEGEVLPDMDDYDIEKTGRTVWHYKGKPLYAFGHGLTYSPFRYLDLKITAEGEKTDQIPGAAPGCEEPDCVPETAVKGEKPCRVPGKAVKGEAFCRDMKTDSGDESEKPAAEKIPESSPGYPAAGGNAMSRSENAVPQHPDFLAVLTVENCGGVKSDQVVQIYVREPSKEAPKAIRRLIAFRRLHDVMPGERRTVTMRIPYQELRYYDVVSGKFLVEEGSYIFEAGAASDDIRLQRTVFVRGERRGLRTGMRPVPVDHWDDYENIILDQGPSGGMIAEECSARIQNPALPGRVVYRSCAPVPDGSFLRLCLAAPKGGSLNVFLDGNPAAFWSGKRESFGEIVLPCGCAFTAASGSAARPEDCADGEKIREMQPGVCAESKRAWPEASASGEKTVETQPGVSVDGRRTRPEASASGEKTVETQPGVSVDSRRTRPEDCADGEKIREIQPGVCAESGRTEGESFTAGDSVTLTLEFTGDIRLASIRLPGR